MPTNRLRMNLHQCCLWSILLEILYLNLNVQNIFFNKEQDMEGCTNLLSTGTYSDPTQMLSTFCKEFQLKSPNKSMSKLLIYWRFYITSIKKAKLQPWIHPVNRVKNSKTESKRRYKNKLKDLTKNIKWILILILS